MVSSKAMNMMKLMGWNEGTGLGKDSEGSTEPIKVAVKNNNRGVGCKNEDIYSINNRFIDEADALLSKNRNVNSSQIASGADDVFEESKKQNADKPMKKKDKSKKKKVKKAK